jgi:hypothetical protein
LQVKIALKEKAWLIELSPEIRKTPSHSEDTSEEYMSAILSLFLKASPFGK